jgi:5-carboxymethyl-2-hydroxymuconate isomerase
MPHISIDYSANLEDVVDMPAFCAALRDASVETGVFPLAGIRVRATRVDHAVIADGDPAHGFIDMSLRLRGGRDLDTRKAATAHVFEAAKAFLAPVIETRSIALSFEMRDIDPELSPKLSTIRDHMKEG